MDQPVDLYGATYGKFLAGVREQTRREAYGEDIGQNSWLLADAYRRYLGWLALEPVAAALDVACGAGGPALFLGRVCGCQVEGMDIQGAAIAAANQMAREAGLDSRAHFRQGDASQPLPFAAERFDALLCIDAINHLSNRQRVLLEWQRVLKPGGRLLFTDPAIVTGLVSNEELAIRSSNGFFLFTPPGEDERLLQAAGFDLLRQEDSTADVALLAQRRFDTRAAHREELLALESEDAFERMQRFLTVAAALASERRLSRTVFLARKAER
ncbi:MAG TPA: methyltransferase domain-containing protein [Ktedonobacterales bacterium]|jgi:SAM-dependent methyltransferase